MDENALIAKDLKRAVERLHHCQASFLEDVAANPVPPTSPKTVKNDTGPLAPVAWVA